MNRRHRWITELTLTQQLFGLIFLFVVIFPVFFFLYLEGNIDDFVTSQMYRVIDRAQENIIYTFYSIGPPHSGEFVNVNPDINTANAIFANTGVYRSPSWYELNPLLLQEITHNMTGQDVGSMHYVWHHDGERIIYRITRTEDATLFITVISETYQQIFRSTLIGSVINVLLIVVTILFSLLLIWVTYIIHPFNQMRNYINKIKSNEPATLNINRKDEIGEIANALVELSAEIRRQEQIKEELIQNISHDLKTPIATIKSYGESINDGVYPYETLEKSVDVIIEHADRLEKKVHSLLLLNRMGYLVTNKEVGTIDLEAVIEKTILSLKVIRPEIEIILDTKEAQFYGDEEPWRVVMENLMDNALRYARTKITITLDENYVSVENNGPQLSKERQEKLFKPYEKGNQGQFGLGLSIVHRVVTAYGYEIHAENTEDGVIFRIKKIKKKERLLGKKKST